MSEFEESYQPGKTAGGTEMTNDTNKNDGLTAPRPEKNGTEPLDLSINFIRNKFSAMQMNVTEHYFRPHGDWVAYVKFLLQEIERLRDKVRLYEKYCAEQEDKGAYIEHSGWLRQERRRTND